MKIKIIPILFIIAFSCTSSAEKEKEEMLKEVMSLHDEMMPEMGKITKFSKEAKTRSEALFADTLKSNDEQAMMLENLSTELKAANESMMVWMRSFDRNYQGEPEEVMEYFQQKKTEMETVKKQMQSSKEKAEKLLKDQ